MPLINLSIAQHLTNLRNIWSIAQRTCNRVNVRVRIRARVWVRPSYRVRVRLGLALGLCKWPNAQRVSLNAQCVWSNTQIFQIRLSDSLDNWQKSPLPSFFRGNVFTALKCCSAFAIGTSISPSKYAPRQSPTIAPTSEPRNLLDIIAAMFVYFRSESSRGISTMGNPKFVFLMSGISSSSSSSVSSVGAVQQVEAVQRRAARYTLSRYRRTSRYHWHLHKH